MARIQYETKRFRADRLLLIEKINAILASYAAQGFATMTLRQIYYQLVKANEIENKETSYDNLGSLITDARRAGLIDWSNMEDRTRNLRQTSSWLTTRQMIRNARYWYTYPKWANQEVFLEGWVEKDALIGVLQVPCNEWDIPYFACRGYMSDIEMWAAAQRVEQRYQATTQTTVILHFGDHDPSGIDMTRDIQARFDYFLGSSAYCEVRRLALNMDQIHEKNPPPNPAKLTDSRAIGYIERFGNSSWELDALDPTDINELVQGAVDEYRDVAKWEEALAMETAGRDQMRALYAQWPAIERVIGTQNSFLPKDNYINPDNHNDTGFGEDDGG